MEINRNIYMMIGLVILLVGIQFRLVDTFVLTPESTRFLAERMKKMKKPEVTRPKLFPNLLSTAPVVRRHSWRPKKWIGWAMLSAGGVIVLHSLVMKKPGG